jgi:hypothetical protein
MLNKTVERQKGKQMSEETIRAAGTLLVIFPTVAFGGVSILYLWMRDSDYMKNPLRRRMWTAGHAHAGVLLILSLVLLAFVDQTTLSGGLLLAARWLVPISAILIPAAFFLSVVRRDVQQPNALIYLAYLGFGTLTAGFLIVGLGLLNVL